MVTPRETVDALAQNDESAKKEEISRRRFLAAGWIGFIGFVFSCIAITITDFFKPKVLFEAPMSFKAGLPEGYPMDTVNTRWIETQKVWLVRNEKGLYALSAVCTHLGCTPRWVHEEGLFKCPCHGSNFTIEGNPVSGPASLPLWRYSIGLAEDGQVVVSKSIKENRVAYREGEKFLLPV